MKNKLKVLLVLIVSTFTISLISNTYSRYIVDAASNLEMQFSKWQILINENDITDNNSSEIVLAPVLEENENIKANTFAPTSKGYFDILVDPTNVELSFDYTITLELLNQDMPDLLISNYSLIDSSYNENDTLTLNNIENNQIKGTLIYDNQEENYSFEPFTIRIYFEWYEGENELMDDISDTQVSNTQDNLQIKANIQFTQKI
ncbi:MAG: hypothetical protein ACI33S_00975 [Bacilli bacterium]